MKYLGGTILVMRLLNLIILILRLEKLVRKQILKIGKHGCEKSNEKTIEFFIT